MSGLDWNALDWSALDWSALNGGLRVWSGLDWVLIVVVAASALLGLMRGFVGVVASLAAWVLAVWAALRFGGPLAVLLAGGGAPGPGQLLAGYALGFIVVLLLVGVAGWLLRKLVRSVGLSGIDRVLGLLLGLLRGAVVACVLVLLMGLTAIPRTPDWQRSQVVPVFLPGALWLRGWLPDWVAQRVDLGVGAPAPAIPGAKPAPPDPGSPELPEPVTPRPIAPAPA